MHFAAFLFGMTGILGTLIDADSNVITFGRAVFAVVALTPILTWLGNRHRSNPLTSSVEVPNNAPNNAPNEAPVPSRLTGRYLASGVLLAVH
jgi:hypothetical protein